MIRYKYRYKFCRRFQIDIWGDLTKKVFINKGIFITLNFPTIVRRVRYKFYLKALKFLNPKIFIFRVDETPENRKMRLKRPKNLNFNALKHALFDFYMNLNRRYFKMLYSYYVRTKGYFVDMFLRHLEMRLDSILFRMNFVSTFKEARHLISHKRIIVNGIIINDVGFPLKPGDLITLEHFTALEAQKKFIKNLQMFKIPLLFPKYMEVNFILMIGIIHKLPKSIYEIPYFFKFPRSRLLTTFFDNFR